MAEGQQQAPGTRALAGTQRYLAEVGSRWLLLGAALVVGVILLATSWQGLDTWAAGRAWDTTAVVLFAAPALEAGVLVGLVLRTWGRWQRLVATLAAAIWIANVVNLGLVAGIYATTSSS